VHSCIKEFGDDDDDDDDDDDNKNNIYLPDKPWRPIGL
jgi:hypothetical protein